MLRPREGLGKVVLRTWGSPDPSLRKHLFLSDFTTFTTAFLPPGLGSSACPHSQARMALEYKLVKALQGREEAGACVDHALSYIGPWLPLQCMMEAVREFSWNCVRMKTQVTFEEILKRRRLERKQCLSFGFRTH